MNPDKRDLFAVSALFLFLELAFIRWFPAQVLFLTFFTNTVLLASFLGLSLGCLAARHSRDYLKWTPVLLVLGIVAGSGMEWVRLALQDILNVGGNKASPQMVYFGTEAKVSDVASFVVPIEVVMIGFFAIITATMVGIGQVLARKLSKVRNAIEGYMLNIGGSLAGILVFQVFSLSLPPVAWFGAACAVLVYFLWRQRSRWPVAFAIAAPLLLLVPEHFDVGVIRERFPVETWSPYYRINYSPESRTIVVNLIGHQNMVSRSEPFPAYAIPHLLNRDTGGREYRSILIIGAGSGNDVSRALQWAAPDAHVDAVEIDPVIFATGKRDHPDRPYQDPRVTAHINDGRNFLRSTQKKYDLVVFALVDSLVLHSSVSNIRLESYLFTREAMEDVRRCLAPDGMFVMYNYFRQGWIVARLAKTLEGVFRDQPVVLTFPFQENVTMDQKADGFTVFFAGGRTASLARAFAERGVYHLNGGVAPGPSSPDGFGVKEGIRLQPARVEIGSDLRIAEDVWPFLYLRNPMVPSLTWRGIVLIGIASVALLWYFGWRTGAEQRTSMNAVMLLMGAGFMLLEAKAVVHMALMFGSTWTVNTVVFSAILVMILLANLWVLRRSVSALTPYYIGLMGTLALNVVVPLDRFLGLPGAIQVLAAGALVLSPVFCAGVIFAVLFRGSSMPDQALAYNTAGAIAGGLAESASLLIGFNNLVGVAAAIYAGSWVVQRRIAK